MNKSESYKIVKRILEKHAGIGNDILLGTAGNTALNMIVPAGGGIAGLTGMLHGMTTPTPSLEDIQEMDETPGRSAIPGVGSSRVWRRRRALRKLLKDKPGYFNLPLSELSGALLNPALMMAGGALGGDTGAAIGLGIGGGGSVLGSLAALLTKRRSLEEQARVENSKTRAVLRHIVPGLAAYDYWKGMGATRNLSGDDLDMIRAKIRDIRARRKGVQTNAHEREQEAMKLVDEYMQSQGATRLL